MATIEKTVDMIIDKILNDGVNLELVKELIKQHYCDTDARLRVALILSGDIETPENIPTNSYVGYNRCIATFKSYNLFTNEVLYEYPNSSVYYFTNEEDAKHYADTGEKYHFDYKSKEDELHPIKGIYNYKSTSGCDLDHWLAHAE